VRNQSFDLKKEFLKYFRNGLKEIYFETIPMAIINENPLIALDLYIIEL